MNRRGFLQVLSAAIAVAASGVPIIELVENAPILKVRHLTSYNIFDREFLHRIDVRIEKHQFTVDFKCLSELPNKAVIEDALAALANRIQKDHGQLYSMEVMSFGTDLTAANKWWKS